MLRICFLCCWLSTAWAHPYYFRYLTLPLLTEPGGSPVFQVHRYPLRETGNLTLPRKPRALRLSCQARSGLVKTVYLVNRNRRIIFQVQDPAQRVYLPLPKRARYPLTVFIETQGSLLSDSVVLRLDSVDYRRKKNVSAYGVRKRFRFARVVRDNHEDGIHTTRIPGIIRTKRGTLIACFALRRRSSADLQNYTDIGIRCSFNDGETWDPTRLVLTMAGALGEGGSGNGVDDPAILYDSLRDQIWIAALWAHGKIGSRTWTASDTGLSPFTTAQTLLIRSKDEGQTWSMPYNITRQIKDPAWKICFQAPGIGIVTPGGRLIFSAQYKAKTDANRADTSAPYVPHATIVYSDDAGKSWHIGEGAQPYTSESQVALLPDGQLRISLRDESDRNRYFLGRRLFMLGDTSGRHWVFDTSMRDLLPDPICMAAMLRVPYKSGTATLFSQPQYTFKSSQMYQRFLSGKCTHASIFKRLGWVRKDMGIALSLDEGHSIPYRIILNEIPGYGYSSMTNMGNDRIGILYEGMGMLYFQIVPLSDFFAL